MKLAFPALCHLVFVFVCLAPRCHAHGSSVEQAEKIYVQRDGMRASSRPGSDPRLPLRTSGRFILDAEGKRVRFACVNWYGAHLEQMVANGLNRQSVDFIAELIARYGFNCVRLPFSLDMIFSNATQVPDPDVSLAANPWLKTRIPLQVFDATLQALTDRGLMVILNSHVSTSAWCCDMSDGQGLWYTKAYPMDAWLEGLATITARYRNNSLVVGFDLRNEVRPSQLGNPSWGSGPTQDDWAEASVVAAKRVVSENEDMLIIISGLFFGIFLCDVPNRQVHVAEPVLRNRTIYTAHEYNWFNFHLVARGVLLGFLIAVLAVCLTLWTCLLVGWQLEARQRLPTGCMRRVSRRLGIVREDQREGCCARRLGRAAPCFEFGCAVASTLTSILSIYFSGHFLRSCSYWDFGKGITLSFTFLVFLLISVVLWLRLALASVKRRQLELERQHGERLASYEGRQTAASLEAPTEVEVAAASSSMTARPVSESGPPAARERVELSEVNQAREAVERGDPQLRTPATRAPTASAADSPGSIRRASVAIDWNSSAGAISSSLRSVGSRRLSETRRTVACVEKYRERVRCLREVRSGRYLAFAVLIMVVAAVSAVIYDFGRYERFSQELDTRWGFLLEGPHAAPVWLGEFGTDSRDMWWDHLMRYLAEKDAEWAYWSFNGEKYNNEEEEFGLLMRDSYTPRHDWVLKDLQELIRGADLPVPAPAASASSRAAAEISEPVLESDWLFTPFAR